MFLHPDFPKDPYTALDPEVRWFPGVCYEKLFLSYTYQQEAVLPITERSFKVIRIRRN